MASDSDAQHRLALPSDHNLPYGWRHEVTGRRSVDLDPLLVRAGAHHRRARYMSRLSQAELARRARVSQSQVSRFERALAPSMDAERLIRLSELLHPHFPIGYCPHEHLCPWQPIAMPSLPVGVGPPRDPDFARFWAIYNEIHNGQGEESERLAAALGPNTRVSRFGG